MAESTGDFVRRIASEPRPAGADHFLTDDELRRYALESMRLHDPALQAGNGYDRCEHCHYTRHPCDVYELAQIVLALLDRGRDGTMESDAD